MKPFELPLAESIHGVWMQNGHHHHHVRPGTFRMDQDGRVEWRDGAEGAPADDLYVTHLDRITYVIAKVPVEQPTEGQP